MDGGGRFLRPLTGLFVAPFALARSQAPQDHPTAPAKLVPPRRRRRARGRLHRAALHPAATLTLLAGVLFSAGAYGAVRGGAYAQFIEEIGTPGDLAARALGLGVSQVTISGINELKEIEILKQSGVKARNSLPFLDASMIRDRLRALPLVQDADVRKLYPNRLAITIVERQPYALWQKNGEVVVVAADGTAIDTMHDDRFARLPLVVGEGANARIQEYLGIVAAAGPLAERIKAGELIAQRRWSVYFKNGVEAKLPERDPVAAMTKLARLAKDDRLLEKDIQSVDLRVPDRVIVRLTEEAAAARAETTSKIAKGKV
ncbi:MAG: FtsQ-type POTRA domain-containing protein [Hyphomicrobiales bacterium]|nr:FtsQ-type POTRA domain-containing protein [Hyphomicrobiales bacterium]